MNCQPLEGLIQAAYVRFADGHFTLGRLVPIEGIPAWARSERYADILIVLDDYRCYSEELARPRI